ncbi:MAG: hypothetical protein ACRD1T_08145 [Acidimicrobiia bacterium]
MDLRDLTVHAVLGSSAGSWYWIANSQSVHPQQQIRWNSRQGTHPFVLLADFNGVSPAVVRGRSRTRESDFPHSAHPSGHEDSCKITSDGWIAAEWSLKPEVVCGENYSCVEPDKDILLNRLRNGAPP